MNETFFKVVRKSKRNIVIHHTHLIDNIISFLQYDDLLFFDDCIYSQYLFIRNNIEKIKELNINCVLGVSSNLICQNTDKQITDIKTSELHDRIHTGDTTALNGFMTICEINELLRFDNIFIANHGYDHIELNNLSETEQIKTFISDFKQSQKFLKEHNLTTDIFVYPYDLVVKGSEHYLQKNGYHYIYPSSKTKRVYIEDL